MKNCRIFFLTSLLLMHRTTKAALDTGADAEIMKLELGKQLIEAVRIGKKNQAFQLLEKGAPINACTEKGNTALHCAITRSNSPFRSSSPLIELLLDYGADCNQQNIFGVAPIHIIAERNNPRRMLYLLRHGLANPNLQAHDGTTPLHRAVFSRNGEPIIALLLHCGAVPHIRDNEGNTPLYYAQKLHHQQAAKLLEESAPDAETQGSPQVTTTE